MPIRAIVLGAALLALSDVMIRTAWPHSHWVTALGGPWLCVAWWAASGSRSPRDGAIAGILTIAGGTLAYYAMMAARSSDPRALVPIAVGWTVASVAVGGALGALGHARRRRPVLSLAGLGSCLVGESILLATTWPSETLPYTGLQAVAGASALVVAVRRADGDRRRATTAILIAVVLVIVAAAGLRALLRTVGWGGP